MLMLSELRHKTLLFGTMKTKGEWIATQRAYHAANAGNGGRKATRSK
jgi:hypothetical protein